MHAGNDGENDEQRRPQGLSRKITCTFLSVGEKRSTSVPVAARAHVDAVCSFVVASERASPPVVITDPHADETLLEN